MTRVEGHSVGRFALRNKAGELVEEEQQFKDLADEFWGSIFDKGHWPEETRRRSTRQAGHKKLTRHMKESMVKDISMEEVEEAIRKLKVDTSSGTMDIPVILIKKAPGEWVSLLREWMNATLDQEKWPRQSKRMDVTLLHKKGPTEVLQNYRTLSVGCNICKLFTRVINDRMEKIVEELDLLTEIQQGFQRGRRAEENLFVLETVMAQRTRYRGVMNVALLDITKAYDRVDRDILWKKLKAWEWPEKIITLFKEMYQGVYGVITFQGYQSRRLPLDIGLKQGCVLSPLLFALYIAELSTLLQKANIGPTLSGTKVPGLFFADDMLLFGNNRDMEKALAIVADFAERHKIEFAGHKSMVIPLTDGDKNRGKRWKLGKKWLPEGEEVQIVMEDDTKGKYLGVTIRRQCNNFVPFWSEKVSRATHQVRVIKEATRGMPRMTQVAKKVYDTYTMPRLLYGTDVARISNQHLKKLQVSQNEIMRLALKAPAWTNTALLHKASGIWPLDMEIANKKIQLWRYLSSLPDERYAKKAFGHQLQWLHEDMGIELENRKWSGYWVSLTHDLIETYEVSQAELTSKERIKMRLKHKTSDIIRAKLQDEKYRWIVGTGWCAMEQDISTLTPCWLWHRMRWGILEDQYQLRFPFDRISQKVRLRNCVREWIGKRPVPLDDIVAPQQIRQKICADKTQDSEEMDSDLDLSRDVSNVDINPSDSEDEGEDMGISDTLRPLIVEEGNEEGIEEGIGESIEEGKDKAKRGRRCWMCGKDDSIRHLLWTCPAISTGFHDLIPEGVETPARILMDDDLADSTSRDWLNWWMSSDRDRQERQTFGDRLAVAIGRRFRWCRDQGIRIQSVQQMEVFEEKLQQDIRHGGPLEN